MAYNQRFAKLNFNIPQQLDDGIDLPTDDINAVTKITSILQTDNQALGSKVQSFEREFDKTWERVAVDSTGAIAKLPPLFSSLRLKIEATKQRQQQIDAIFVSNTNNGNRQESAGPQSSNQTATSSSLHAATAGIIGSSLQSTLTNKHGVIRSMCVVVDLSESSLEKDIRPTRFDFLTTLAGQFISAFIDQHPLSEVSSLTVAQGHCKLRTAVRQPKSDYTQELKKCQDRTEPKGGVFSIQNAIHSCGHLLQSSPPQACKEIVILTCSLNTVDVKDIEDTIQYCIDQDITINIIGLDARVRIFDRIASSTGGVYDIACDSTEYYNAVFRHLKPPIKQKKHSTRGWLQVAFPSVKTAARRDVVAKTKGGGAGIGGLAKDNVVSLSSLLCLCHNKLRDRIYVCPTCSASVCQIPNQCPICKTLLLSYPLLAKSASQLHIPPPTTPVHFNDKLLPIKDLELVSVDDSLEKVIKRPRTKFKKDVVQSGPGQNLFQNRDDGIKYIDDGMTLTKTTDDQLVELDSMTFSTRVNTAQIVATIQQWMKAQKLRRKGPKGHKDQLNLNVEPGHEKIQGPSNEMTDRTTGTPQTSGLPQATSTGTNSSITLHETPLETFAVYSPSCQSHVVNCQACTCPIIVPTTQLLETALVFAEDVTNVRICSCPVCKHTDLVTSCSVCGCFLCHDCDELTQTLLQNCPGCFS